MGKSYKQLSLVERALLQTQLVLRCSPAAIAAGLQRARSTITREIARNGWLAEPEVTLRGVLGSRAAIVQIAFTLGSMDEPVRLSHETIYTALYAIHPTDEDLSAGPRPCHADNCVPAFSPCCAAPIGIAACVRRARTGVSPSPT